MRIGLPRALLYYRYGPFWEKFFTGLGAEVVVSRRTDKALLQSGLAHVSSEVCLPIKIAAGHLLDLRDRVDVVFFPRMVWLEDRQYACPKMIGIVDIARMVLGGRVGLLTPSIKGDFAMPHLLAGLRVNANPAAVLRAYHRARPELRRGGCTETGRADRSVALIGHFYNLEDDYVGHTIRRTFERSGYRVLVKEALPEAVLRGRCGFARAIRWVYERELYNAFQSLSTRSDGACVVVSMGCGPDSLVAEFMHDDAEKRRIPYLQLVLDEHTGTAGLVTRIEAFVEMMERRRATTRAA